MIKGMTQKQARELLYTVLDHNRPVRLTCASKNAQDHVRHQIYRARKTELRRLAAIADTPVEYFTHEIETIQIKRADNFGLILDPLNLSQLEIEDLHTGVKFTVGTDDEL